MTPLSFGDLPELVLGRLAGRSEADWQRAPAGKWTPAQIVEHLALGIESSAQRFLDRRGKPPMTRRNKRCPAAYSLSPGP